MRARRPKDLSSFNYSGRETIKFNNCKRPLGELMTVNFAKRIPFGSCLRNKKKKKPFCGNRSFSILYRSVDDSSRSRTISSQLWYLQAENNRDIIGHTVHSLRVRFTIKLVRIIRFCLATFGITFCRIARNLISYHFFIC